MGNVYTHIFSKLSFVYKDYVCKLLTTANYYSAFHNQGERPDCSFSIYTIVFGYLNGPPSFIVLSIVSVSLFSCVWVQTTDVSFLESSHGIFV